jgi:hypothetical protein
LYIYIYIHSQNSIRYVARYLHGWMMSQNHSIHTYLDDPFKHLVVLDV